MRELDDFFNSVADLKRSLRELYERDDVPWIVACSYGKDSSAVLQLVWQMLLEIPEPHKPVHVVTSDTGVENPLMWLWVERCCDEVRGAADEQNLPIVVHQIRPEPKNRFWACLIGKGYSRPSRLFRWCTPRLKIVPSFDYIRQLSNRGAIVLTGKRSAESSNRAASVERDLERADESGLTPTDETNVYQLNPIHDWSNSETWIFLSQTKGWRESNRSLQEFYGSLSDENECPLVISSNTDPCGTRTGCWTCTLVNKDRSFHHAVSDEANAWMEPLLEFRDELAQNDHHLRDHRRYHGKVELYEKDGELVPTPGPYLKEVRHHFLRRVLEIQKHIEQTAPPEYKGYQIITYEELLEIRKIWIDEKLEWEDALLEIYEEVMGKPFFLPCQTQKILDRESYSALVEVCDSPEELELLSALLGVEQKYSFKSSRSGIFGDLEKAFETRSHDKIAQINSAMEKRKFKQLAEDSPQEAIDELKSSQLSLSWASMKFKEKA